jgi:hypothetical protein
MLGTFRIACRVAFMQSGYLFQLIMGGLAGLGARLIKWMF